MITYKNLLVLLDGSKLSEAVMPFATQLAKRLNMNVTFLNVFDPDKSELESMHRAYIDSMANDFRQQLVKAGKSANVQGKILSGNPADEILNYAKDHSDLILMATHGNSGLLRWAFGGVADKVLRSSNLPVWLVKVNSTKEMNYDKWPGINLLIPLDGSQTAEKILPHVESMIKQRGIDVTDITLLRVCDPPSISADYPDNMSISWDEHVRLLTKHMERTSRAYLEGVEKRLSSAGLKVQSKVLMGKPADEIVKYAANISFSLVAMTTNGLSGITQWSYGSVAAKVLAGLSCPILLVRPNK